MFARLLDIGESKLSVLIRYSDVLVEARESPPAGSDNFLARGQ